MRLKIILAISLIAFSPAMASRGLVVAAIEGDAARTSLLLESGDDPNSATPEGATPLVAAASAGNVEIIELLLAAGASVNQLGVDKLGPEAQDRILATPVQWAAINGHLEAVRVLLVAGADPNIESPRDGSNPLLAAVIHGDLDIAKLLVENGANPNSATIYGQTPLDLAVSKSNLGMAKMLLEAGADPNLITEMAIVVDNPLATEGKQTFTVREPQIFWAFIGTKSKQEIEQMVALLLEYGADPNASSKGKWFPSVKIPAGSTPLHLATAKGLVSTVAKLIQAGANVNAASTNEFTTPLHLADASPEIAELLLEAGANVDAVDNNGASPLHYAAQNGNVDTMKILLAAGAQVNLAAKGESLTKKPMGLTPLNFAVDAGHLEAVRLLLEQGADPNPVPYPGLDELSTEFSALHMAAIERRPDLLTLLIDAGAKVELAGEFSFEFLGGPGMEPVKKLVVAGTPLAVSALRGKDPETIRLLVQAGADPNLPAKGVADPKLSFTPLHLAVIMEPHPEAVAALIELGATVDARDSGGMTALHWSAWRGAAEPAGILLSAGANPTLKDQAGKTALDYARESKNAELVALLEKAMANRN